MCRMWKVAFCLLACLDLVWYPSIFSEIKVAPVSVTEEKCGFVQNLESRALQEDDSDIMNVTTVRGLHADEILNSTRIQH